MKTSTNVNTITPLVATSSIADAKIPKTTLPTPNKTLIIAVFLNPVFN